MWRLLATPVFKVFTHTPNDGQLITRSESLFCYGKKNTENELSPVHFSLTLLVFVVGSECKQMRYNATNIF